MSTREEYPLTVLVLPDYRRENPYQALLAAASAQCGVEARFPLGYRWVLPIWRAAGEGRARPEIAHLHV